MKSRSELVNEISARVLLEIIFTEKKNFNTKEKKDFFLDSFFPIDYHGSE